MTLNKEEAIKWAILFHNKYEELAPSFGYETRADTKAFDLKSKNGKLMTEVCGAIIDKAVTEARENIINEIKKGYCANDKCAGCKVFRDIIKNLNQPI